MLSNKEVSGIFKTMGGLMELHGENDFKAKSYVNAAFQIGRLSESVLQMSPEALDKQPGIGKSIVAKIIELRDTGTIAAMEELIQITPPGLLEMLRIKGLGGKKVSAIWNTLGIESVGELLYACYENRLAKLKGFGDKTQQSVIDAIEYYQTNLGKFHYAAVADEANEIIEIMRTTLKGDKIDLTGAIRRQCNTIEELGILCSDAYPIEKHISAFAFFIPELITEQKISGKTPNGLKFTITIVPDALYYYTLFVGTGSEEHVQSVIAKIGNRTAFAHETEIYTAAGLSFIAPSLREPELMQDHSGFHDLITDADIRGVVHNHSTWSDGKNTISEMADACISAGYSYFVISDHSKTAVYAGGLTEQAIKEQHKEVDKLNADLAVPFKIYKSIECDILNDGAMDYADSVLKSFDFVIASIHQNLKMDEQKATHRLLKAIENPYTTILGHVTGRLLLSRPGYPVDHKKIIEACASNDVVIEINANPYRLDIDHTWIPYAQQKGVMISINPDAHSTGGIGDIRWGVISARKGGLKRENTFNAMTSAELDAWIHNRKKKKGIL